MEKFINFLKIGLITPKNRKNVKKRIPDTETLHRKTLEKIHIQRDKTTNQKKIRKLHIQHTKKTIRTSNPKRGKNRQHNTILVEHNHKSTDLRSNDSTTHSMEQKTTRHKQNSNKNTDKLPHTANHWKLCKQQTNQKIRHRLSRDMQRHRTTQKNTSRDKTHLRNEYTQNTPLHIQRIRIHNHAKRKKGQLRQGSSKEQSDTIWCRRILQDGDGSNKRWTL